MKKGRLIALSAVCAALSVVVMTLGAFFSVFDLSAVFIAGIIVMVPLSKDAPRAALLTVAATAVLSLFTSGFNFAVVLPYALFFGLHPIVNYFAEKKNFNKIAVFIVKDVWFVATLVLMQAFTELIAVDLGSLRKFVYPLIIVLGAVFFVLYDVAIRRFQKMLASLMKRFNI